MEETLLKELSNTDLDWMITQSEREKLAEGQTLLDLRQQQDIIHILIGGRFSLSYVLNSENSSPQSLAIYELGQGEVVGIGALLGMAEAGIVKALEPSMVMTLPLAQVQTKLASDLGFAAHFYHAIAGMLSTRLRRTFEHPDRVQFWGDRSSKEVLSVFGELRDSDLDWLVSFGEIQVIPADKVLLQAGRPVDALYILLDGQMSISAPQPGAFNPLYLCFAGLEESTRDQRAFATLAQGAMPGIIAFLDSRPLPVTIRTVKESLVFAVPRQTLATKLQVDDSFASRFYRVVAIEVLELLQSVSLRLVQAGAADPTAADLLDEELDLDELQQMSDGAKKFNWMLSQLGVTLHG